MSPLSVARIARHALTGTLLVAGLTVGLPRTAHAASAPPALRTLTVTATHLAFPTRLSAGLLALRVIGAAHDGLSLSVARVHPGVRWATVEAASARGDLQRLSRIVTFLGGVGVPPQHTGTVVVDLRTPGQYGVHLQQGDHDSGRDLLFTVTPAGPSAATVAAARVHVTLAGTRLVGLPPSLPAGTTTFQVRNTSSGLRDMVLFRLDPGKTLQDMKAAIKEAQQTHQDPSWAHDAGDADLLSAQQTAWVTLTLVPGTYVAFCPLSDPQNGGEPFALEGMLTAVTVS